MNFTDHWTGYIALAVFLAAYALVLSKRVFIFTRKSKPVMVAAGVIWILTAIAYASQQQTHLVAEILRHNLLEYAELMLFLLSAMTFINTMVERNVFAALRTGLVSLGWSFRGVFWVTGILAFLISPVAANAIALRVNVTLELIKPPRILGFIRPLSLSVMRAVAWQRPGIPVHP